MEARWRRCGDQTASHWLVSICAELTDVRQCVLGGLIAPFYSVFQAASFHAWLGDLSHLSLIALPGMRWLSPCCPIPQNMTHVQQNPQPAAYFSHLGSSCSDGVFEGVATAEGKGGVIQVKLKSWTKTLMLNFKIQNKTLLRFIFGGADLALSDLCNQKKQVAAFSV